MDSDSMAVRRQLQVLSTRPDLDPAEHEARVQAGVVVYEAARNDGLCHEGAWECALEAVREPMASPRLP